MKKIAALLLLLVGFIVGWGTASIIAHRNIEKFKKGWSPESQRFMAENAEFTKGLTKADMEQFRKDIRDYSFHAMNEREIQTLWQGILATQIQSALAKGNMNRVNELLTDRLTTLKEACSEGRFKGTDSEKLADSVVRRMGAGTNAPTTEHEFKQSLSPSLAPIKSH